MGGATNGPFLGALWKAEEINIGTRGTMWGVCGAGWRSKKLRNYGGKLQRTFRPRGQQSWKKYLRSKKPFGVFWDKKCKGCQQARKKKCNARMPIVLPTLVWLVCAETIALKTDASIIWEPPATCYQPPRISPHETGGLETLPTYPPHRAGITEGLLISNTIFCITRVSPRELGFSNHHVSWPRSFYRAKIFQGTRTVYNWVEPTEKNPFWKHHRIYQMQKPMAKSVKNNFLGIPQKLQKLQSLSHFYLAGRLRKKPAALIVGLVQKWKPSSSTATWRIIWFGG